MSARRPARVPDPRVDRARHDLAVLCVEGDHEACGRWLVGVDAPDRASEVLVAYRRCGCGCHADPWPFEHDG